MQAARWFGSFGTIVAVLSLTLTIAACDDGGAGEATATSPSAATSTGAPETAPAATSTESAGQTPAAEGLEIEAQDIAFDTNALQAPAGEAFTVLLKNRDDGIPHTFSLYQSKEAVDANEDPLATTGQVTGPADAPVDIPALDAGEYYFQCDVHPQMNGTLTVQ